MEYDTQRRRWYQAAVVTDGTVSEPLYLPYINVQYPITVTAFPVANATISYTAAHPDAIEAETAEWYDAVEIPVLIDGPVTAIRCTAAGADVTLRALING